MRRRVLLAFASAALVVSVPLAGGADAPPPPVIAASVPASPANNNNPVLSGSAAPGTLITIYANGCPASVTVGTGVAGSSGAFEVQVAVPVPDNTSTAFYATATGMTPPKTSACSAAFTYVEDSLPPPVPAVASGPSSPTGLPTAHFTFSDAEAGVTFVCNLDDAGFVPCTNPQDFSVGDGSHTLSVAAVDAAGNQSDPSAPYSWTVDTADPLVTLTSTPPVLTNQTSAAFAFTSSPVVNNYKCQLDGGGFVNCVSPQVYTGLANGTHRFEVYAPSLGKAPAAYAWTVDTVPPQTTIASGPPSQSKSAAATFAFTSNEARSTFSCSLDGSGFTLCASPMVYSGLGDGQHVFRVQAVDAAGNADASAAPYAWTISGVGPETIDHTAPHNVRKLSRRVGYGRLQLRWRNPSDGDFDHVELYVSTNPRSGARRLVYRGRRQTYTNRRFKNGLYYGYRLVSVDRAKNASTGTTTAVRPSALLRWPRDRQVVHSPPVLRWMPVRGASFYNVQLYNRGGKILSAWPPRQQRALARRWTYGGRRYSLRAGTYVWFVWPGFGPRSKSRYGQLLGQGTFKVR